MTHYRLLIGQDERGPYTFEQLKSMWSSGMITADTHFWTDGMDAWQPIEDLGLDSAIKVLNHRPAHTLASAASQRRSHEVYHSGDVTTKAKGSGTVAIGTIMCIVGVCLALGGSFFYPSLGIIGVILLVVGFFIAVVGRLMG
jgi:hypothetical protein